MKGGEILQTAIRNFNSITGIMIKEKKDKKGNTVATINNGLKAWTFEVLIKNEIREIHLPRNVNILFAWKDWALKTGEQ